MDGWKFEVGQRIRYTTTGHGSNEREAVILECLPAGKKTDRVLAKGLFRLSYVDRYIVETARLGKNGPVKTGTMDVMAPNRWQIEKNAVLIEDNVEG